MEHRIARGRRAIGRRSLLVALLCALLAGACATPEKRYAKHFAPGIYACAGCGAELFQSTAKFDSNTRWPSFRGAVDGAVVTRLDTSLDMRRTEVLCARCGRHLGHVFEDGERTGDTAPDARWRYCVLSASLDFRREESAATAP